MPTEVQGSSSFRTTVAGSGGKTGIVVPDEVISRPGAGRRPAVHMALDGYRYRSTVAVMRAVHVQGERGRTGGDRPAVGRTVATTPREVDVPREGRQR